MPEKKAVPDGPWTRLHPDRAAAGLGARRLFTFDLEGRLVEAFVDGVGYRRGLDNRLLERRPDPGAEGLSRRRRRFLSAPEAEAVVRVALETVERAQACGFAPVPAMSLEELEEDSRRFRRVYRPIGILPPDQYQSIVLQLTSGCWYNRCTFCTFYRDRRFEVRGAAAFRRHIHDVKAFFGRGLLRRHSVFLGDANALMLPSRRLAEHLEDVTGALPGLEVCGFLDAFSGRRKRATEWRELARRGLSRVYVGLESGSDEVLSFLAKPGTAEDALETVRAIRAGGTGVGVILLVGAGGDRFDGEHVQKSVDLVNRMGLGAGDELLLSPLVTSPGSPYEKAAAAAGTAPLPGAGMRRQAEAIIDGVRLGRGARWSYYFVEEFLY